VELITALGRGPVGLDTAIFIYYIEEHPRYLPLVEPVFAGIDEGRRDGVTSALTLLETLVIRTGRATWPSRG
jgi:predicted nucleic acid-binding protein